MPVAIFPSHAGCRRLIVSARGEKDLAGEQQWDGRWTTLIDRDPYSAIGGRRVLAWPSAWVPTAGRTSSSWGFHGAASRWRPRWRSGWRRISTSWWRGSWALRV